MIRYEAFTPSEQTDACAMPAAANEPREAALERVLRNAKAWHEAESDTLFRRTDCVAAWRLAEHRAQISAINAVLAPADTTPRKFMGCSHERGCDSPVCCEAVSSCIDRAAPPSTGERA